jgi:predicted DNA-binding protein with PD1-like motif
MPPEPVWSEVRGAREVLGTGTVFWDVNEPKIHLHAAMGHHGDTLTACVRKGTKVYLVLEVMIIELEGIEATRPWYEIGGFNRLTYA